MNKIGMWMVVGIVAALCFTSTGSTQTEDEILALHEAAQQALLDQNIELYQTEYDAPDGVWDFVPFPAPLTEHEQGQAFFNELFQAFPDFTFSEGLTLVHGNVLVEEHSLVGEHKDVWQGIPPVDPPNTIQFAHLDIFEHKIDENGKLVRYHSTTYMDMQVVMIQMGAMPVVDAPAFEASFDLPDPVPTGRSPLEVITASDALWNEKDLVNYAKDFTPDAELFIAALGIPMDLNAYIGAQEMYLESFSNRKMELVRRIDMGDGWIVNEVVFAGTHDGPFLGIPPTGRPFRVRGVNFGRINEQGLISYSHTYYDGITLLTQLGLLPGSSSSENWELYK